MKPLAYLTEAISAGMNNENDLNLKRLDRPYFIAHGKSTQVGSRGIVLACCGCTIAQVITSVIMRTRMSGESSPFAESHSITYVSTVSVDTTHVCAKSK